MTIPLKMPNLGHNDYMPGYKPSHIRHHEWRTAENSANHLVPELQRLARKSPKISLLDVGSGSGTITQGLARYIPDGIVTATDLSEEIHQRSRQLASVAGVTNINFQQASVYSLPFDDASFDVTHAHQVLCHLDAPADAIKEMYRVTKPGGIVALRESDLQSQCVWPELDGVVRFNKLLCDMMDASGGSSRGGRRLIEWVTKAGITREQINPSFGTWCFSQPEDRLVWGKYCCPMCG